MNELTRQVDLDAAAWGAEMRRCCQALPDLRGGNEMDATTHLRAMVLERLLNNDRPGARRLVESYLQTARGALNRGVALAFLAEFRYRDDGDSEDVRSLLLAAERLLQAYPAELPRVLIPLAGISAARGDLRGVEQAMRRAESIVRRRPEARWCLGRLLAQRAKVRRFQGDMLSAVADLNRALQESASEDPAERPLVVMTLHIQTAWSLLRLGDSGAAQSHLQACNLRAATPAMVACHRAVDAEYHVGLGDFDGARTRLEEPHPDPEPSIYLALACGVLAVAERDGGALTCAVTLVKRLALQHQQEWAIPVARRLQLQNADHQGRGGAPYEAG